MICIVFAAVFPFGLQSLTDFQSKIGRYSYVAKIKQLVQIRTQKDSITYTVRPIQRIWLYVGCLQHRQSSLACYRATPLICVSNKHAECPLSEATPREVCVSKPLFFVKFVRGSEFLNCRNRRHRLTDLLP